MRVHQPSGLGSPPRAPARQPRERPGHRHGSLNQAPTGQYRAYTHRAASPSGHPQGSMPPAPKLRLRTYVHIYIFVRSISSLPITHSASRHSNSLCHSLLLCPGSSALQPLIQLASPSIAGLGRPLGLGPCLHLGRAAVPSPPGLEHMDCPSPCNLAGCVPPVHTCSIS